MYGSELSDSDLGLGLRLGEGKGRGEIKADRQAKLALLPWRFLFQSADFHDESL